MKLASRLIEYINVYIRQIILLILWLRIKPKSNILMLGKGDNLLENFVLYVDNKSVLHGPDIETNNINLVSESLNIEN